MINEFGEYSIIQRLAGKHTQWKKDYPDGEWAALVLSDKQITRKIVEEAFKAHENYAKFPDQGLAPQFFKLRKSWKTVSKKQADTLIKD